MTSRNPVFCSPDPLDQRVDPLDQQDDPLDQANRSWALEDDLPPLGPREIKALRERLRLTQRQFAAWFGFPVATLRHWERGNRRPAGPAMILLEVIRENPRVVLQAVRKARARNPGGIAKIEPLKSYRSPPGYGDLKED